MVSCVFFAIGVIFCLKKRVSWSKFKERCELCFLVKCLLRAKNGNNGKRKKRTNAHEEDTNREKRNKQKDRREKPEQQKPLVKLAASALGAWRITGQNNGQTDA